MDAVQHIVNLKHNSPAFRSVLYQADPKIKELIELEVLKQLIPT